jgi:hypothetical protein
LIDDLVDYSGTAEWAGTSVAGEVYQYDGVYWLATVSGNTIPGGTGWKLAPKFTTECYENMYTSTLGVMFSYMVIRESLLPATLDFSSSGLVRRFGKEFESASSQDLKDALRFYDVKIKRLSELFDEDMRNCFNLVTKKRSYVRGSGFEVG